MFIARLISGLLLALMAISCAHEHSMPSSGNAGRGFHPLFTGEGMPAGWSVRQWDDLKKPADAGVEWKVIQGVLHGSEPRGTWLMSDRTYSDFQLVFDWKLGERGNSGTALRAPLFGDPAFDGMELQMVDPRYYPSDMKVTPAELTASLYKAVAPKVQVFKPMDWNHYDITCKGDKVKVLLNGQLVLDVNLAKELSPTKRHDDTDAPPLAQRPRSGHIGFQELSRGGGHVEIKNARLREF